MRELRPFGPHELYIEGDLVLSIVKGMVTLADVRQLLACMEEVISRYGYFMLLADNARFVGIDADARRHSALWTADKRILGMATYNASFTARTLLSLIMKGINLLNPNPLQFTFVKSEAEARAWLAEQRRRYLDQAGRGPAGKAGGAA